MISAEAAANVLPPEVTTTETTHLPGPAINAGPLDNPTKQACRGVLATRPSGARNTTRIRQSRGNGPRWNADGDTDPPAVSTHACTLPAGSLQFAAAGAAAAGLAANTPRPIAATATALPPRITL
ncbi:MULTISPECIES: hypothetical protein [unclassified Crossiella]|uniref:hypothetical protein n=1 Tax=unclassified Crossiella TaxID=2620835 RepID=UPI001FFF246F|nr:MULTISPECIES: hypothetical protein [unclassified Crossiella]MCK2239240.1 hypothetical protein [Crossiella sp. S99.2]MCK2251191.1 hypothetical protein [Crossiella sp. S99.1]